MTPYAIAARLLNKPISCFECIHFDDHPGEPICIFYAAASGVRRAYLDQHEMLETQRYLSNAEFCYRYHMDIKLASPSRLRLFSSIGLRAAATEPTDNSAV